MKSKFFAQVAVVSLAAVIGGTGCRTHQKPPDLINIPGGGPKIADSGATKVPEGDKAPLNTAPTPVNPTPTEPSPTPAGIPSSTEDWTGFVNDHDTLKPNTIYFDYDSAVIKKSEMKNLDTVAKYLKGSPADSVGIEGNCDERGTPEYNRALGERRAQAAREYLVKVGKISANRILTKSYGDQRPASPGHDDASRAKNRRDEFVVLKPK